MARQRMHIKVILYLMMTIGSISTAYAQSEFGVMSSSNTPPAPQTLIDLPTAGTLAKGTAGMSLRVFTNGGLLGGVYAGISDRLMLGISFGGSNILGTGKITWNPRPEVAIKYLVLTETSVLPAIAFGFDSQGFGPYDDNLNRYQIKSRGFYGVLTRNIPLAGTLGLHAGVNYGIENKDNDGKYNIFLGADKSINQNLSVMIEYDFAENDDQSLPGKGRNKGYLNLGARVTLGGRFGIEFDLRNLIDNRTGSVSPSRELKILYTEGFDF